MQSNGGGSWRHQPRPSIIKALKESLDKFLNSDNADSDSTVAWQPRARIGDASESEGTVREEAVAVREYPLNVGEHPLDINCQHCCWIYGRKHLQQPRLPEMVSGDDALVAYCLREEYSILRKNDKLYSALDEIEGSIGRQLTTSEFNDAYRKACLPSDSYFDQSVARELAVPRQELPEGVVARGAVDVDWGPAHSRASVAEEGEEHAAPGNDFEVVDSGGFHIA